MVSTFVDTTPVPLSTYSCLCLKKGGLVSITPQTNIDLATMADKLLACDNFVISGHVSPDGDCIGSALALAEALRQQGKTVTCVLASNDPVDGNLRFLPGVETLIPAQMFDGVAQTFIGVDVPLRSRLGDYTPALLDACDTSFTIDHHAVETPMCEWVYVDPDVSSTTLLIWELAKLLGADRSGVIAEACYTGLVTDTGRFQYQNTTPEAFAAAAEMLEAGVDVAKVSREIYQSRSLPSLELEARAIDRMEMLHDDRVVMSWLSRADFEELHAIKADAEPVIDKLRSIKGVSVACILREQEDHIRGSFRAKDNTDVSELARKLNGGGHRAAAGFTLNMPLEEAKELVAQLLEEAVLLP